MSQVVDCHCHFVPPSLVDLLRGNSLAGVSVEEDAGRLRFSFDGLPPSPRAPRAITETAVAQQWMDRSGVDTLLLAPWTDLLGYTLGRAESTAWTHAMNQALGAIAAANDRFGALGSVSLQFPELAAEQLRSLRTLGCSGAMIGTRGPDIELDDPRLDVLWATASELGLPLVIHPIFLAEDLTPNHRLAAFGLKNAVGRANETSLAVARLLYRGVLSAHPDLKIVVSHGGASLPTLLPRLLRNREVFAPDAADPLSEFRRLYFDSVVLAPSLLEQLVDLVGHENVLLGSDYPFPWEPSPMDVVKRAQLEERQREAIYGGNARRLFRLEGVTAEEPPTTAAHPKVTGRRTPASSPLESNRAPSNGRR